MPEAFGVTPAELRATSRHLTEVSDRMKGVMSTLRAELAALGAPWGDDKIGDQFANGSDGFLAQLDWVEGSVDAKTKLLDYYARVLAEAADAFEHADEAPTSRGDGGGRGLPAASPSSVISGTGTDTGVGATFAGAAPSDATGQRVTSGGPVTDPTTGESFPTVAGDSTGGTSPADRSAPSVVPGAESAAGDGANPAGAHSADDTPADSNPVPADPGIA